MEQADRDRDALSLDPADSSPTCTLSPAPLGPRGTLGAPTPQSVQWWEWAGVPKRAPYLARGVGWASSAHKQGAVRSDAGLPIICASLTLGVHRARFEKGPSPGHPHCFAGIKSVREGL